MSQKHSQTPPSSDPTLPAAHLYFLLYNKHSDMSVTLAKPCVQSPYLPHSRKTYYIYSISLPGPQSPVWRA